MAIAFRGGATGSDGNGGDVSLTLPVGTAAADYALVSYNPGENSDVDCAMVSSGYTELVDLYEDDTSDANLGVFRKFMGAPPDSFAVVDGTGNVGSGVSAIAMVYSGVDQTTPEDVAVTTATGINGAIPDPPSITPVTDGAEIVVIGSSGVSDAAVTPPSGYGNDTQVTASTGRDSTTAGASLNLATAAAENPPAWTNWASNANFSWAAVTVALRPASGGGNAASGSVASGAATVAGTASVQRAATGSVASQSAAVAGDAAVQRDVAAAVAAQLSQILGDIAVQRAASGSVESGAAQVTGSATIPGSGTYQPLAIEFDGINDRGARGADLTGNADSKLVTFSVWVKFPPIAGIGTIFGSEGSRFFLRMLADGTFSIGALDTIGGNVINAGSNISGLDDDAWHHICGAFDVGFNQKAILVDDASVFTGTIADAEIDFTRTDHFFGSSNGSGSSAEQMCIADLWIAFGTWLDVSDTAVRRKFVGAGAATSVDLGPNGENPTGSSPILYFSKRGSDTDDDFLTNKGTGGGFTVTGALATCATNPPPAETTVSGNVQSAAAVVAGDIGRQVAVVGELVSQSASIAGSLTRDLNVSGNVQSQSATVVGAITLISVFGNVVSGAATVAGTIGRQVAVVGTVVSESAVVSGIAALVRSVTGALQSGAARVTGLASVFTFFWREADDTINGGWSEESSTSADWTEESPPNGDWTEEDAP